MISVIITTNTQRNTVIVPETQTIRQTLEAEGVDYTRGTMRLDGAPLGAGDFDKSFAAFGVTEKCYLSAVVKADNAAA